MDNLYKIAVVQYPPVYLNLEESTLLAQRYIAQAADEGARLIVFPETWLPGYPVWLDYAPNAGLWDHPPAKSIYRVLSRNSLQINDKYFQRLQKTASQKEIIVIIGANERAGRTLYNTLFYFKPDGTYDLHRKLMPTYTERLVWGMGDGSTLPVIEDEETRIGGLVCWEHWMPLARAAMYEKSEHIHIAQWPMVKELHLIASRHYAFEAQCYVIAAGCTLTKERMLEGLRSVLREDEKNSLELIESIPDNNGERILQGGSCVIRPNTEYLISPVLNTETLIFSELNIDLLAEGNLFMDANGHYSRPDVFQLKVDTEAKKNVHFENR